MALIDIKRPQVFSFGSSEKSIYGPIGMDIGLEQLNLVQLMKNAMGDISVVAKSQVPFSGSRDELLGSPKRFSRLVREALKQAKFRGKDVVSALPYGSVRILSMTYFKGAKSDDEAILELLSGRIDGSLSEHVVDYLPVRANKGDEESLAVVAISKRETVMQYLDLLTKSGLEPTALEIGPSAIRRLVCEMSGVDDPDTVLVINFGRALSYLTMVSGRRLLFDQEVDFGEKRLLQHLTETLEISPDMILELVQSHGLSTGLADPASSIDEDDVSKTIMEILKPEFLKLVDEITRALVYAASETRGKPVGRIYLLGGVARWKGTDELLQNMLELPVSTIPDPLHPFKQPDQDAPGHQPQGVPEIAVAVGLALRGLTDYA